MKKTLILLAGFLFLTSCGTKPKQVDGKEGHPRQYPAPPTADISGHATPARILPNRVP